MTRYHHPALKQLADQQVRFAPRDLRLQQTDRAETLLNELNASDEYPYTEICSRITSRKTEMYPDLTIPGRDVIHDLRLFVEDMSDSADLSAESYGDQVMTVDEISKHYNVSTKTVDRWRNRGLVSRRFRFGNRKRIGFLRTSVENFVRSHPDEVQRGRSFSQLTSGEREAIISSARRMAQRGMCPAQIGKELSRQTGRSPETIRYTLKHFDEEHPDLAIFPRASRPLTAGQRELLYLDYQRKVPMERLAVRYGRTRASVYRILAEIRAEKLLASPIDFMDSPDFHVANAETSILCEAPVVEGKQTKQRVPPGLPPYLASLYNIPLLTREEEVYYFRKMNYLKFRAAALLQGLDPRGGKPKLMDQIEALLAQSVEVKNHLIRCNLRLVVSIAKKHIKPTTNFFEMVSDGNMSLIRAIEKFDYTKGNKFSTYASWAIMKNFARSLPAESTQQDRYRTGQDLLFQSSFDHKSNPYEQELHHLRRQEAVSQILGQLDERERQIIECRFGLDRGTEPLTLEQVGNRFGVTKERIRQLEIRALNKLRSLVKIEGMDIPGV